MKKQKLKKREESKKKGEKRWMRESGKEINRNKKGKKRKRKKEKEEETKKLYCFGL